MMCNAMQHDASFFSGFGTTILFDNSSFSFHQNKYVVIGRFIKITTINYDLAKPYLVF